MARDKTYLLHGLHCVLNLVNSALYVQGQIQNSTHIDASPSSGASDGVGAGREGEGLEVGDTVVVGEGIHY